MTNALAAIHDATYGGVYYSANIDFTNSGVQPTWARMATTGLANTLIKVMQNDPGAPYTNIYVQLDNDDIYRWNGASWTKILDLATARSDTGYAAGVLGYITVDRSTNGTIYIPISQSTVGVSLIKSTNYGANWSQVTVANDVFVTAVAYAQCYGQYLHVCVGWLYRHHLYSSNGGTSWTDQAIWDNTSGGAPVRMDFKNPTKMYYRDDSTNSILAEIIAPATKTSLQAALTLGSDVHDRHWIDPNVSGHQRILRVTTDTKLFSTVDSWANVISATPTQLQNSTGWSRLAAAGENDDYILYGDTGTSRTGHKVWAINGETSGTTWGINGANVSTPPYTNAIPGTQDVYVAVEGLFVGEGPADSGVYVYADELGDITDIPSYDGLGRPMFGDRASWRDRNIDGFDVYHAEDVRRAAREIHTPQPTGNDGWGIIEVDGYWVNSSGVMELQGAAGTRYLGVYNYTTGGVLNYRVGLVSSNNLRDWTIISEPIIDLGTSGQFDDVHCRCPRIVSVAGILYVYYDAYDGSTWSIGLSRSFDGGATWVKYGQVLTASQVWESGDVNRPLVYYDVDEANAAKRWKMWYSTEAGGGGVGIGYAYSADGLTWTKYGSNPVIAAGGGGSWNDTYLDTGAIIKRGSTYLLFYDGKSGTTWKGGLATFTDPEGTYTQSADNPILEGDGLNTAISVNVVVGDTQITVADATIFEIGAPVWVRDASNWYLTRVAEQVSSTVLEMEDAAPDAITAATGFVTSIASGSVDFMAIIYDDGYLFMVNTHQPIGGAALVKELCMLGYSEDLSSVSIDYSAGVMVPTTLTESRDDIISRENLSVVDTWESLAWHEPPAPVAAGDVTGPAGATDGAWALFDGATGKLLKDGGLPTLNNLSDVDMTGVGTGDIMYKTAGNYEDYPLGITTKIARVLGKIKFGDIAGGDYVSIDDTTGNLRLEGNATAWEDLRISASIAKPGATAPSYKAFGPSGSLQALMFEAGHHDEVFFEVQLPHAWKQGSRIYPHVHWAPVDTTAGNVVWELEYSWANINGTFGAPGNMATAATAAGGTAWVHKLTVLSESGNDYIDGTGKTFSSMIICRLHRNSNAGSDTLNKDVALLEIDFHYEIDSFGSDTEYSKDTSAALLMETGDYLLLETGDKLLLE